MHAVMRVSPQIFTACPTLKNAGLISKSKNYSDVSETLNTLIKTSHALYHQSKCCGIVKVGSESIIFSM